MAEASPARHGNLETGEPSSRAPLELDASGPNSEHDARVVGLVNEHFDFIWRSLRRLGVPAAVVDDATQKVFWIASQKLRMARVDRDRSFLFAVALRVAADERRALRRRPEVADAARCEEAEDVAPSADELVERRQARELLDQFLDDMPLELRAVFVLFEIEEMSTSEIATLLDIPPGTVASRLRRARETFEERVARFRARRPGGGAR
jgi:RNA polymerase sigma-70 factor (ECF subfamily)